MSYISVIFLIFVLVLLLIYYMFPRYQMWILLIGNIFFYLSYSFKMFFFLLGAVIISFFAALIIYKSAKKNIKKLCLISAIGINTFLLVSIKFYPWISSKLNGVYELPVLNLLLPLGISYYTLQMISYLVDVYKDKIEPERNIFRYMAFVTYFPYIVQGPISRFGEMREQLFSKHEFDQEGFFEGFLLVIYGLVKKVIIANRLAVIVNTVFADCANNYGFTLYITILLYSVELYMDFSGCVCICRGVSKLFNIRLSDNFNAPYFSRSIKEFWQRWHISLSMWLRDYIYIPLGGNRKGTVRKYCNLVLTFLVSGLWHGAGANYLIWGGLHALYQICGEKTQGVRKKIRERMHIVPESVSEKIYQTLITFHLVAFAWIFFRAEGITGAGLFLKNLFARFNPWVLFDGSFYGFGIDEQNFMIVITFVVLVFAIEFLYYIKKYNLPEYIKQMHLPLRWGICISLICAVLLLGWYGPGYEAGAFIYGGF